jgi:hypothetical protein
MFHPSEHRLVWLLPADLLAVKSFCIQARHHAQFLNANATALKREKNSRKDRQQKEKVDLRNRGIDPFWMLTD